MNWQRVDLGAVPPSRWRNGGGVTRELAAWPRSDSWIWRMAVAEVAQDGPFSNFAGVERWFAVLSGGGVALSIGAKTHQLTRSDAPLCFDGGLATDCRLLAGATQDFNLMLRPDRATAHLRRISGSVDVVLDGPRTVAVYAIDTPASVLCAQDTLTIPGNTLAWQTLPAGSAIRVNAAQALWIEIELRAADSASRTS